ncbi:hypothetical protein ACFWY5_29740 [Nonomuraea sp. NPDC059007]|uniref:hypothetical protein n=1 Tax=Nonomuraea sp. NPDC059007 TaxID=3346692 RepID=UPI003697621D
MNWNIRQSVAKDGKVVKLVEIEADEYQTVVFDESDGKLRVIITLPADRNTDITGFLEQETTPSR